MKSHNSKKYSHKIIFLSGMAAMLLSMLLFTDFASARLILVVAPRGCGSEPWDRDYFTDTAYSGTAEERNYGWHMSEIDLILEKLQTHQAQYALQQARYLLCRFPNYPQGLSMLPLIAREMKAPELPIPYFEYAISLFPQYGITHAQYGAYLVDIGQSEKGIGELQEAIKLDAKLVQAYLWLADAYYKKHDRARGDQALNQARAMGYKDK